MDPVTIGLIAQILIKYGPAAAEAIVGLFHKTTPVTQEDWSGVFAKAREHLTAQSYIDQAGGLPPGPTGGTQ